ncbi:MAG: 16S rRNA (cytosine(967)-C(5))-methyltransferase RsmB, partial [Lachnospiraceae bacterium]|nr:16S rRNA (cytosine(967)-C(5))-methyltransferase RsmB [Lachnospiraceae bacterium]
MENQVNTRLIVLECLLDILEKSDYSHVVLGNVLSNNQYLEKYERAFITRLCEGTVEEMIKLDYIIDSYSTVKVKKMKPVIRNILRMGVYQILYMDNVPESAACNEAVKLALKKGFKNLKGFVNGVLRNIARDKDNIKLPDKEKDYNKYLSVNYSMPLWIVEMFVNEYGKEKTEKILEAFLKEKPTTICANNIERDKLKGLLSDCGIDVKEGILSPRSLYISGYNYLTGIDAFNEGYFFVQDESSMCAVMAAGIKENDIVLDVCAAPGGKTMYAAGELNKTGLVSARDISYNKVQKIEDNIRRCNIENVETKVQDALVLDNEYVDKADVVIADLPCSGLGVIGTKPDIKYKITKEQIDELKNLQRNILDVCCRYLKKGGILIFSTCTISKG